MINVTLGEVKPQEEKPFPKLMIDQYGKLFYFFRPSLGLPLQEPDREPTSKTWASAWDMGFFTDYNEPITIQNA